MVQEVYPNVVLLEFQFTNSKLVPPSAQRVERNEPKLVEKRQKNGIASGEHGKGELVTVKEFVKQLFGLGYKPADLHFYVKKSDKANGSNKSRFVLVINFTKNGAIVVDLRGEDVKILTQLIDKDAWGYIHQFFNPNGIMSIHCLRRIPDEGNQPEVGEYIFEPDETEAGCVYEKVAQA